MSRGRWLTCSARERGSCQGLRRSVRADPHLCVPATLRLHVDTRDVWRGAGGRLCDPNDPQFDDTDRENGLAGVDFTETFEYLVLGKFERKETDAIAPSCDNPLSQPCDKVNTLLHDNPL